MTHPDKPTPAPDAEEVRKMLDGVTDGPWFANLQVTPSQSGTIGIDALGKRLFGHLCDVVVRMRGAKVNFSEGEANARFIAWARTAVPALSAERDALAAERDQLEQDLADMRDNADTAFRRGYYAGRNGE